MNKIEMPDGSTWPKTNAAAVVNAALQPAAETPAEPPPQRTRLVIATELDGVEKDIATAEEHVAELKADRLKLVDELRYFGVRRRASKAKE